MLRDPGSSLSTKLEIGSTANFIQSLFFAINKRSR